MTLPVWKRAVLVPILLFALWLLTDDDSNSFQNDHHLAVYTALRRHPPCARVYRSLLEINLLLWGAAISLWLWNKTIGRKMIGYLLFQPVTMDETAIFAPTMTPNRYFPVDTDDFAPVTAEDILMLGKHPDTGINREEPMTDAHYESDGEVSELTMHLSHTQTTSNKSIEPLNAKDLTDIAVNSLVLILISLFLFTVSSSEGGRYVDGMEGIGYFRLVALVAAPIFPLVLFLGGVVVAVFPWKRKKEFWKLVYITVGAPIYHVTFRDGFIGDILTSSVRPLRDIAFTFFYIFSGLQGWWKRSYDLDSADLPLESNWILHTVIFPMCMASPLWWRFMQNLRQTYDNKKRWPYLGNALKYFIAAEVAIFGAYNPAKKQTFVWLSAFVIATLYQIGWDVFMDWELLEFDGGKVRLRKTRIYSVKWMYWTIFIVNIILRFCWTLSFLPPHYLNRAGVLSNQFEGDLSHFLNPMIASAEIVRRMLWGFLRVELEAIKVARRQPILKGAWSDCDTEVETEMKSMKTEGSISNSEEIQIQDFHSMQKGWVSNEMHLMTDGQILGELCIYSAAFTALGMIAAAHRMTY